MPGTAFGLCLAGTFLYTGDTRPIPELLAVFADGRTAGARLRPPGNPSHSGLPDLIREYPEGLRRQLVVYHYGSTADAGALAAAGLRVAAAGEDLPLPAPAEPALAHERAVRRRLGLASLD